MRIAVCHNFYQLAGGEDQVFADEIRLLQQHGHDVVTFTVHNDDIENMSRLKLSARTIWNGPMRKRITAWRILSSRMYFIFTTHFPLMSPAVYSAARATGAAVVQTLHNYRLMCVNAQFFRENSPCEDCLGKSIPLPGIVHGCYRNSKAASAVAAAMLVTHRVIGTWQTQVDAYIALTQFARGKISSWRTAEDRVVVKTKFHRSRSKCGAGRRWLRFVCRSAGRRQGPSNAVGCVGEARSFCFAQASGRWRDGQRSSPGKRNPAECGMARPAEHRRSLRIHESRAFRGHPIVVVRRGCRKHWSNRSPAELRSSAPSEERCLKRSIISAPDCFSNPATPMNWPIKFDGCLPILMLSSECESKPVGNLKTNSAHREITIC